MAVALITGPFVFTVVMTVFACSCQASAKKAIEELSKR